MCYEGKIKKVYIQNNEIIMCEFEGGIKKKYSLEIIIKRYPRFIKLKENKNLLNKVKVDVGGYGIYWDEELDLAAEEIWDNGETIL